MTKLGKELAVGDNVKVWWSPGIDRILKIHDYKGPLEHLWEGGARIACFALGARSGMTCGNNEQFEVVE